MQWVGPSARPGRDTVPAYLLRLRRHGRGSMIVRVIAAMLGGYALLCLLVLVGHTIQMWREE